MTHSSSSCSSCGSKWLQYNTYSFNITGCHNCTGKMVMSIALLQYRCRNYDSSSSRKINYDNISSQGAVCRGGRWGLFLSLFFSSLLLP